ncbi:maleylpyruvate isomerase family mycothiol-dependent enzyme [Tsukamurella paurometabola]|uniref:Maleylpyruvate isomerase family mycothiol-dependent enzyme n=1 Tax=Tsukamurella paurometabola TaxID=2061 RepID=A0A3P8MC02_TSUPA|nr:maleylpyruvate isomerase family mycothiol-dependent enzyme [Tsukamurella paurometabola]MBS4100849.1 maleylpyruvate isomerase family mycothiol-dependent enzyme [Tsukamurella paurometabola]UEA84703.1 maleylpyruvate isomerase family mycothiol-dependent enzyme [Tsukamurella paurometabola]VDR37283.1 mycothiol-dependent maleylpyruvate isomerase [Tsukamurella paurometabola]
MSDVWQLVHAERRALIAFLEGIDDARWDTPSLCPGWRVRDVVAHQIATADTTRLGFLKGMLLARFDFDRDNQNGVDRELGPAAQMLDRFRSIVDRTSGPPAPLDTRLVEVVVHGEDVRRPLGTVGDYPMEAVERALRLQARTGKGIGGAKEHVAGLTLRATDADVTIGDGPEVTGPLLDLLLVVSGRTVALGALGGPGAPSLAARVA